MKLAIICSTKDPAGMNIRKHLLELGIERKEGFSLHVIEDETIFHNNIDNEISADVFVFATKHKSASGVKSLTAHVQGNWGKADMGGEPGKLGIAAAPLIKSALKNLSHENIGYEVVQEATHHGPLMEKPSMFIEIGSSEAEWADENAGRVVAQAILDLNPEECLAAVGIGGIHYARNMMPTQLKTKIAIGHICPKYALADFDAEKFRLACERTWPKKAEVAIVDWKGLGEYKEKVVEILERSGIRWQKSSTINHNL
jgi:D-aminoacyl-tRNA deacylase